MRGLARRHLLTGQCKPPETTVHCKSALSRVRCTLVSCVLFLIAKCVRLKSKLFHQRAHRFGRSLANKPNSTVSFITIAWDSSFPPRESSRVVWVFPDFPTSRPSNVRFCRSSVLFSTCLGKVYSSFSIEISLLLGGHLWVDSTYSSSHRTFYMMLIFFAKLLRAEFEHRRSHRLNRLFPVPRHI